MLVALEPPDRPDVVALIAELDAYQDSLYPPEARYALDITSLKQSHVLFAVARDKHNVAIGCGAVVLEGEVAEVKRMYVHPGSRGKGVAMQVLDFLEAEARLRGCKTAMLETGPYQAEALAFYSKAGYVRRGPFGTYPEHPLSVFLEKRLQARN
jgi:putative acetyltransferase